MPGQLDPIATGREPGAAESGRQPARKNFLGAVRAPVLAAALSLTLGAAQAAYIVDTGPAVPSVVNYLLNAGQSLAMSFSVDGAYRINSVEGWITTFGYGTTGGGLLVELYAGDTPNGERVASGGTWLEAAQLGNWRGVSGLDWDITAGTYTLAFVAGTALDASMGRVATNPLASEWYRKDKWTESDLRLGVRIDATPAVSPVPEPASVALMAMGLAAVGVAAWRRRSGQPS